MVAGGAPGSPGWRQSKGKAGEEPATATAFVPGAGVTIGVEAVGGGRQHERRRRRRSEEAVEADAVAAAAAAADSQEPGLLVTLLPHPLIQTAPDAGGFEGQEAAAAGARLGRSSKKPVRFTSPAKQAVAGESAAGQQQRQQQQQAGGSGRAAGHKRGASPAVAHEAAAAARSKQQRTTPVAAAAAAAGEVTPPPPLAVMDSEDQSIAEVGCCACFFGSSWGACPPGLCSSHASRFLMCFAALILLRLLPHSLLRPYLPSAVCAFTLAPEAWLQQVPIQQGWLWQVPWRRCRR